MQILESDKQIGKQRVPAGTVLFLQGAHVSSIMVLHSGMAELLSSIEQPDAVSSEHLIETSNRVGLVKGISVCGILGLYEKSPLPYSIVTVSDCIITNTPVEEDLLIPTLQKNMRLNLQVLQALVQRIESTVYLFKNYKYLWHKLASIQDSIALAGPFTGAEEVPDDANRYETGIDDYASFLKSQLQAVELEPPQLWDANVFLGKAQDELGLYNQYDAVQAESLFDFGQYTYFKRLIRKPDKLVAAVFYQDEPSNYYVFRFLSDSLKKMMTANQDIIRDIMIIANSLYAEQGPVEKIIGQGLSMNRDYQLFLHYLWKFSWRCLQDADKLLRLKLSEVYPVFKQLLQFRTKPEESDQQDQDTGENLFTGGGNKLAKYRGLFAKILDFSEVSQEFKDKISSTLTQLRAQDDILSTDAEVTALRNKFALLYWKLYEICLLKIINTDLKSFVPGIMLHFGLLDETMVTEEELEVIDEAYSNLLYVSEPIPAMTLPYFLEKIYTGEVQPSMSEMGETFREVLKRQEKMTNKERSAAGHLFTSSPEDKVRYEIRTVAMELAKMLFGSKRKAIPVLCSEAFQGRLARLLLDPESCAAIAGKFHSRDYSLFYREVVSKHKFGTDIVKSEVLPNFVLYPVAGSRMMMWQELDGTKKDTAARMFVPIFFMDKMEESIGTLLGQFRWELSRSVAGANWMDPVEGGMAGAYYDYIAFYKRNPNLSPAHKEKLADFIRKTRSDRDRFCSDYLTWVLFEYEGKLRFNTVIRDIMYRFVPFDAGKREELVKKPLYTDLETKRVNRNRKELLRLESRFKRFEKAGEPVPEEMQRFMDFLNS